jgi:hypothetical protein
MSVRGEFQRYLRDCLVLLETAASGGSGPWQNGLRQAADLGSDDLCAGADQALSCCAQLEAKPPAFRSEPESERFAALVDGLGEVCRSILGRR